MSEFDDHSENKSEDKSDTMSDSKRGLMKDLQSIRSILDESASSDNSIAAEPEKTDAADSRLPGQIPLLQDIFDPDHPEQDMQIEQLKFDKLQPWTNHSLFEDQDDVESEPTADEAEINETSVLDSQSAAESVQPDNESIKQVDDIPDSVYETEAAARQEVPDTDDPDNMDEIEGSYQNYSLHEQEPSDPSPVAQPLAGLSLAETEEFLNLLVEEHVDDIIDIFKEVLRDRLSLLITQSRDGDPIVEAASSEEPIEFYAPPKDPEDFS